jgi:hypothetical protein
VKEFTDVVLGTFTDVAKMLRSLLASRTTWVMLLGFLAVYASSGKIEAFQQLLAYLGLGATWVIKMGVQNIVGQVKGNGTATNTAQAQAAVAMDSGAQTQPAAAQQEITPIAAAQPQIPTPPEPLDIKLFHERVLNDTLARYSEQNPATVFSMAKDRGSITTCLNIKQAQTYWDYLVTLVYDAEQFVREATQVDKPGPCKVRSPEHVQMQLEVMKIVRFRDNVYTLAQTDIDWRKKLGPNDTLYHVGVLAEELLKYNQ